MDVFFLDTTSAKKCVSPLRYSMNSAWMGQLDNGQSGLSTKWICDLMLRSLRSSGLYARLRAPVLSTASAMG